MAKLYQELLGGKVSIYFRWQGEKQLLGQKAESIMTQALET